MNVSSLLTPRPDTPLEDVEALIHTLSTIWERANFWDGPPAGTAPPPV
jgi:hypothetical protein